MGMPPVHAARNDARPGDIDEDEALGGRCLLARWSICVLFAAVAVPAIADRCKVRYAEVVDIDRCGTAQLPDFRVTFTGTTQPRPNLPLLCWNYNVTARNGPASATLSHCHTGELGGEDEFRLDGKPYLFVHGVAEGCRQHANGSVSRVRQGDAFIPGTRDSAALRSFQDEQARASARCLRSAEPSTR